MLHECVVIQSDWWLAVAFWAVALGKGSIAEIELEGQLLAYVAMNSSQVVPRRGRSRAREFGPFAIFAITDSVRGSLQTVAAQQHVEKSAVESKRFLALRRDRTDCACVGGQVLCGKHQLFKTRDPEHDLGVVYVRKQSAELVSFV
jgi:hypothetical protein